MHFSALLSALLLSGLSVAAPQPSLYTELIDLSTASRPTVEQAAAQARRLLRAETVSTLSTVFPSGEPHGLEGHPFGMMDYYADCSEDGSPTLLAMNIATSFRNAAPANATISLSVREHHPYHFSPVAHPRVALLGTLSKVEPDSPEAERVKLCFTRRHPDARLWTPGNKIHESYWVRFEVESVYWIGGFGNIAYIGWIPKELYQNVSMPLDDEGVAVREGRLGGIQHDL